MKFLCANRIAPDGTPRFAASHLGYAVYQLCPTKRTPGLNEFIKHELATVHTAAVNAGIEHVTTLQS